VVRGCWQGSLKRYIVPKKKILGRSAKEEIGGCFETGGREKKQERVGIVPCLRRKGGIGGTNKDALFFQRMLKKIRSSNMTKKKFEKKKKLKGGWWKRRGQPLARKPNFKDVKKRVKGEGQEQTKPHYFDSGGKRMNTQRRDLRREGGGTRKLNHGVRASQSLKRRKKLENQKGGETQEKRRGKLLTHRFLWGRLKSQ